MIGNYNYVPPMTDHLILLVFVAEKYCFCNIIDSLCEQVYYETKKNVCFILGIYKYNKCLLK